MVVVNGRDAQRRTRFEAIYREHSPAIAAYAARRLGPDAAADVVADTFTTAWRRIDDVPGDECVRAWLFVVARNTLSNHRRSRRRADRLVQRLGSDLSAAVRAAAPATERDEALAAAFAALPPADRELLSLHAWDGLTHDELSIVLGCSSPTVRVRLHRARRRLSRALAVPERSEPPLPSLPNGLTHRSEP